VSAREARLLQPVPRREGPRLQPRRLRLAMTRPTQITSSINCFIFIFIKLENLNLKI
jgi:hypothetical protein